jgi:ribosome-associated protein
LFGKEKAIERATKPLKVRSKVKIPEDMGALTLARLAVAAAADKKADDIVLLDLRKLSSVTDYFVICTGAVDRQLEAIADNVVDVLKGKHSIPPRHVEGSGETGWVLIDYVDVVIHVFTPSLRNYYNLEGLWANAPVLLRIQ